MNNIPVDIAGRSLSVLSPTYSANLLTFQRANDLFVNEEGDQMKGDLDMNKSRIKNLGDVVDIKDAANKEYVDNTVAGIDQKMNNEHQKLTNDIQRVTTEVQKVAAEVQKLANEHQQLQNEDNKLDDRLIKHRDRLKTLESQCKVLEDRQNLLIQYNEVIDALPLQYGSVLDIGDSLSTYYKITDHTVEILKRVEWDAFDVNLQITPIINTDFYHDEIFMNIRNYRVEQDPRRYKITLSVLTVRSTNEVWGLHLHAYLLVTIFRKELRSQKLAEFN